MATIGGELLIERAHIIADMFPAEALDRGTGIRGQPRAERTVGQDLVQPPGKSVRVAPVYQKSVVALMYDARQTARC